MKALTRYLKIYLHFWKVAFSWGAMYRADTFFLFLTLIITVFSQTIFFDLVFRAGTSINGWTFSDLLLLLAVFQINWGIFKVFYGRTMEDVMEKILTGQYDYYLMRPINERFLSYCLPPLIKSLPILTSSFVFLFWIINRYQIPVSLLTYITFFFYILVGQIIIFSFSQIAVTTAFFTGWSNDIYATFENTWENSRFPGEAFVGPIYTFLTYFLPVTLFASFPTRVLLRRVGNSYWDWILPIAVSLVCLLISNAYYKFGVSRYTSASS